VLWSILTPDERNHFLKALDDPSSEVAQRLLASEELRKDTVEPWWEVRMVGDDISLVKSKRFGLQPELMSIPSSMVKPLHGGSSLIYNICSIL
jgi:hypothetical protein